MKERYQFVARGRPVGICDARAGRRAAVLPLAASA
jgi:hypothetical protein